MLFRLGSPYHIICVYLYVYFRRQQSYSVQLPNKYSQHKAHYPAVIIVVGSAVGANRMCIIATRGRIVGDNKVITMSQDRPHSTCFHTGTDYGENTGITRSPTMHRHPVQYTCFAHLHLSGEDVITARTGCNHCSLAE